MKRTKKILSLMCALALVFSLSISAMAAQTGTATVAFTENGSTLWATQTVNIGALDPSVKLYLPDPSDDPLPGQVSIIDAGIAAGGLNHTAVTGWDANPWSGDPGAYISYFTGKAPVSNYAEYTDASGVLHGHSWGSGWTASYVLNGVTYVPSVYLSNIALENGMAITYDYSSYDYDWVIE